MSLMNTLSAVAAAAIKAAQENRSDITATATISVPISSSTNPCAGPASYNDRSSGMYGTQAATFPSNAVDRQVLLIKTTGNGPIEYTQAFGIKRDNPPTLAVAPSESNIPRSKDSEQIEKPLRALPQNPSNMTSTIVLSSSSMNSSMPATISASSNLLGMNQGFRMLSGRDSSGALYSFNSRMNHTSSRSSCTEDSKKMMTTMRVPLHLKTQMKPNGTSSTPSSSAPQGQPFLIQKITSMQPSPSYNVVGSDGAHVSDSSKSNSNCSVDKNGVPIVYTLPSSSNPVVAAVSSSTTLVPRRIQMHDSCSPGTLNALGSPQPSHVITSSTNAPKSVGPGNVVLHSRESKVVPTTTACTNGLSTVSKTNIPVKNNVTSSNTPMHFVTKSPKVSIEVILHDHNYHNSSSFRKTVPQSELPSPSKTHCDVQLERAQSLTPPYVYTPPNNSISGNSAPFNGTDVIPHRVINNTTAPLSLSNPKSRKKSGSPMSSNNGRGRRPSGNKTELSTGRRSATAGRRKERRLPKDVSAEDEIKFIRPPVDGFEPLTKTDLSVTKANLSVAMASTSFINPSNSVHKENMISKEHFVLVKESSSKLESNKEDTKKLSSTFPDPAPPKTESNNTTSNSFNPSDISEASNVESNSVSQPANDMVSSSEKDSANNSNAGNSNRKNDEGVTRCICGFEHDDGYMVSCDECDSWQHVDCMGFDRSQDMPESYYCTICKPRSISSLRARNIQAKKRVVFEKHGAYPVFPGLINQVCFDYPDFDENTCTVSMDFSVIDGKKPKENNIKRNVSKANRITVDKEPSRAHSFEATRRKRGRRVSSSGVTRDKGRLAQKRKRLSNDSTEDSAEKRATRLSSFDIDKEEPSSDLRSSRIGGLELRRSKIARKQGLRNSSDQSPKGSPKEISVATDDTPEVISPSDPHVQGDLNSKESLGAPKDEPIMEIPLLSPKGLKPPDVCGLCPYASSPYLEKYHHADNTSSYSQELRAKMTQLVPEEGRVAGMDWDTQAQDKYKLAHVNLEGGKRLKVLLSKLSLGENEAVAQFVGRFQLAQAFVPTKKQTTSGGIYPEPFAFFYQVPLTSLCISIDCRKYGNEARFVRRSCKPNCEIRHVISGAKLLVYVVTTKAVSEDEEFTIPHEYETINAFKVNPPVLPCACNGGEGCGAKLDSIEVKINTKKNGLLTSAPSTMPEPKERRRRVSSRRSSMLEKIVPDQKKEKDIVISDSPNLIPQGKKDKRTVSTEESLPILPRREKRNGQIASKDHDVLKSPKNSENKENPGDIESTSAKKNTKPKKGKVTKEDTENDNVASTVASSLASSVHYEQRNKSLSRDEKKLRDVLKLIEKMENSSKGRKKLKKEKSKDQSGDESVKEKANKKASNEVRANIKSSFPSANAKKSKKRRKATKSSSHRISKSKKPKLISQRKGSNIRSTSTESDTADEASHYVASPETPSPIGPSFRHPGTKKLLMSEWMSEHPASEDPSSKAGSSGNSTPQSLPQAHDSGSAKKRWLRQAISEESDTNINQSMSPRPESPLVDHAGPLKKRRLARASMSSDVSNTPPSTPNNGDGVISESEADFTTEVSSPAPTPVSNDADSISLNAKSADEDKAPTSEKLTSGEVETKNFTDSIAEPVDSDPVDIEPLVETTETSVEPTNENIELSETHEVPLCDNDDKAPVIEKEGLPEKERSPAVSPAKKSRWDVIDPEYPDGLPLLTPYKSFPTRKDNKIKVLSVCSSDVNDNKSDSPFELSSRVETMSETKILYENGVVDTKGSPDQYAPTKRKLSITEYRKRQREESSSPLEEPRGPEKKEDSGEPKRTLAWDSNPTSAELKREELSKKLTTMRFKNHGEHDGSTLKVDRKVGAISPKINDIVGKKTLTPPSSFEHFDRNRLKSLDDLGGSRSAKGNGMILSSPSIPARRLSVPTAGALKQSGMPPLTPAQNGYSPSNRSYGKHMPSPTQKSTSSLPYPPKPLSTSGKNLSLSVSGRNSAQKIVGGVPVGNLIPPPPSVSSAGNFDQRRYPNKNNGYYP